MIKLVRNFLQLVDASFALMYATFDTSQYIDVVGTKPSGVKLPPQIVEKIVKARQAIVDAGDVGTLVLQSAVVLVKTFDDFKSKRNDARNPRGD
ncbi:hypothetical protein CKAH01_08855 [Colletotrichum kahawae]|uniref:Uncharacterized protein n=1 Tax=Colletotrichum kahawae TaxID=34407 RepID=A0AAE0CZQ9_COLKA|nr:hypothetical protein CKAH01_08855 [Colletotrichum kahawae]